jgi:hypothetical protein
MSVRIFLSHERDDKEGLKAFMLLRETMHYDFCFFDRSLADPSKMEDPEYVRRFINDKLHGTSVTVVLIGEKTQESPWVGYEIEESVKRGNGILGIRLEGKSDDPIPPLLTELGARVIDWDPPEFAGAIEDAARETRQ